MAELFINFNATEQVALLSAWYNMSQMKPILLLLLVSCFLSCKKEKAIRQLQKDIAGTWELARYSGFTFNPPLFPPGNGAIIVLDENGGFSRMKHDTVVFNGNYHIQQQKDCYESPLNMAFYTNENNSGGYSYVALDSGRLSFSSPNCYVDGGCTYYRRLK